jgi:AraC-like DNA-binding protein
VIYRIHVPPPPLGSFVECVWFFSGYMPDRPRERILPDGTSELVINLEDVPRKLFDEERPERHQSFRRAWLSGPSSGPKVIDALPDSSLMGARFRPGGLAPFLSEPVPEVANRVIELDALWGASADRLREQLLEEGTPESRIARLERILLGILGGSGADPVAMSALALFERAPLAPRVEAIAEELGLSHKHFVTRFRGAVGLTPKLYCRLLRFRRALEEVHSRPEVDWAGVALEFGYYDQAHFNRDFREFSGLTPSAYRALRGDEAKFVPMPD